jgi:hypothetical protein
LGRPTTRWSPRFAKSLSARNPEVPPEYRAIRKSKSMAKPKRKPKGPVRKPKGPVRKPLRMNSHLHYRIMTAAKDLGIGANALMNLLLWRALGPEMVRRHLLELGENPPPPVEHQLVENIPPKPASLRLARHLYEILEKRLRPVRNWNHLLCRMMEQSIGAFTHEVNFYRDTVASDDYVAQFVEWRKTHPRSSAEAFDNQIRRTLWASDAI